MAVFDGYYLEENCVVLVSKLARENTLKQANWSNAAACAGMRISFRNARSFVVQAFAEIAEERMVFRFSIVLFLGHLSCDKNKI